MVSWSFNDVNVKLVEESKLAHCDKSSSTPSADHQMGDGTSTAFPSWGLFLWNLTAGFTSPASDSTMDRAPKPKR